MLKRLLVLLAFAIALTSDPADAGIVAWNAQTPDYLEIDYLPPLSIQGIECTVPPAPANATGVTVIVSVNLRGRTKIENTSAISWESPHLWAQWSLGYSLALRHPTGGYFGGAATTYLWATNTSDLGNPMMFYWPTNVGWPQAFDGTFDGLGASGRTWQLRGNRSFVVQTSNATAWRTTGPDNRHHFFLDVKGTGGFNGLQPPGAAAQATGNLGVIPIIVQYTVPN